MNLPLRSLRATFRVVKRIRRVEQPAKQAWAADDGQIEGVLLFLAWRSPFIESPAARLLYFQELVRPVFENFPLHVLIELRLG